jgi:gliding motility-associated protein GldL
MSFVYGWGASVVMMGALFKLQHWQYGGLLLTVGLVTEAIIFFLSAFEPPMETYEWSKVYPELNEDFSLADLGEGRSPRNQGGLNPLLSGTELSPELLDKVGRSLNELSDAARGISHISSATVATDNYLKNLNTASESVNSFASVNRKANETVNESVEKLIRSYHTASEQLSDAGKSAVEKLTRGSEQFSSRLAETGKSLEEGLNHVSGSVAGEFKAMGENARLYAGNLDKLNQNLSALNQTFESQLRGSKAQFEANQKFNQDIGQMNELLASSVSELQKYKSNAEQLNKHLESLNTIYGNMLNALSYRK